MPLPVIVGLCGTEVMMVATVLARSRRGVGRVGVAMGMGG